MNKEQFETAKKTVSEWVKERDIEVAETHKNSIPHSTVTETAAYWRFQKRRKVRNWCEREQRVLWSAKPSDKVSVTFVKTYHGWMTVDAKNLSEESL